MPPSEDSRSEGPFGEWTGYYASGTRNEPVVKVTTVLHRNDPIILGMPPGISGKSVALSAANVWLALEKAGVTDVQGVWEYQTRYITVISIKQKYGGHVKRAAMAMLGSTYGYHRRFVIIVDDDVDPSNIDDVLWALATRCDPATAINVINEAWSTPLDPRIAPEARAARQFYQFGCDHRRLPAVSLERAIRQDLLFSGGDAQEDAGEVEGRTQIGLRSQL